MLSSAVPATVMLRYQRWPSGLKLLAIVFATAGFYLATARLGLTLAIPPENKATAVWPPSGIALAAVLLAGARVWPGIWIGAFAANLWDFFAPGNPHAVGPHVAVSSAIAAGSTLQTLLGGFVLHRWIEQPLLLDRARIVFQYVGVVLLVCVVASSIGVTTLVWAGFAPWAKWGFDWWTWWLGDAIGLLVVTPLILSWSTPARIAWETRRLAEAALLLGLLLTIGLLVFAMRSPWEMVTAALAYLTVPLLVWATFRFGQPGATATLALVASMAIWGTVHHRGPFVQNTLYESLLLLQTFVGVLAVTTLALSAVLAERRRAEQAKTTLIVELERALKEIKTLHGMIPICAWCKKIRNDSGLWETIEAYLNRHTDADFSHGICPACFERHSDDVYAELPR